VKERRRSIITNHWWLRDQKRKRLRTSENQVEDAGEPRLTPNSGDKSLAPQAVDPAAVRAQLERILISAPFRNSKRYPSFLRYVVEQELNGAASELKERTIAIDVFGRDPYYDPGADPVVRISAGEVRKRLAQYYQEMTEPDELRIDLPVGSYRPEFSAVHRARPLPAVLPTPSALPAERETRAANEAQGKSKRSVVAACVFALVAALAGLTWAYVATRPTALDLFWRPVIEQRHSVMLCLGRSNFRAGDLQPGFSHAVDPHQAAVAWWDAETLARLAGLVQSKGASLHLFREDEATFSDFQQRPAVLIGAYNDQWTIELMSRMRYTFRRSGNIQWIADRDHPSFQDWKNDLGKTDEQGNLALKQDYGIISRVANPRTGFITVTVAGLWGYGTLAAGRFLTDPKYIQEYIERTGFNLKKGNLQIVVGTEVIHGNPGPPTVLAATSW
jgi:hypothetical protein